MKTNYFLQRRSILLVCFSFLFISVFAGPVGKEKAQQVAQNFLQNKYKISSTTNMLNTYEAIMDQTNSRCVMHVFKGENSFVVIAADDNMYPVLAYSNESSFSARGKVPAFDYWMDGLASEITSVSGLKSNVSPVVSQAWESYSNTYKSGVNKSTNAVAPFLVTFWDQGTGYNYYCPAFPTGPDGRCLTGCVATSMAQAMRYYSYPAQGRGNYGYSHPAFGTLTANYNTTYDWANMPSALISAIDTVSRNAVAKLMYHSGVAVDMDYAPNESGSHTEYIPYSLYTYFKYRRFVEYINRSQYTEDVWRNMLIENLDLHQPIIYSGSGPAGGHAWMCDGYDSPTHFHFNWGWSGSSNGYFYLNNINPSMTFNNGQGAVINLVPDSNIYPVCGNKKYTAKNYTFTDGSYTDPYWNNINCQWQIKPDSIISTDTLKLSFIEFKTEAGNDVLTVYDGTSASGTKLGDFSGTTIPATLISTTGSFFLVFVTNGSVTDLGWKVKYDIAHLPTVGLQENNAASQFSVYPNPAHGSLNIAGDFKNAENVKYTISNILGAEVVKSEINVNQGYQSKSIDISQLKGGVYMISVESQSGKSFSKFVVE